MTQGITHNEAFSRNIGWVKPTELNALRRKCVAIAGLGGVGGSHLLALTRLGIGNFNISDFDRFEVPNFNRQAGASISTIGKPKIDVLASMARDINQDLSISKFPEGVNARNVRSFLSGADVYVDGLDFFALEARRLVFKTCYEMGIPAITVAPVGMGAALLSFKPGGLSFEEYFQLEGCSYEEQLLRFLVGVSPRLLQAKYLIEPAAFDILQGKAPSTPMGCELSTAIAATETLKVLLKRGKVRWAPAGMHFDAYRHKVVNTWRPWGNRNWIQRITLALLKRRLDKTAAAPQAITPATENATCPVPSLNLRSTASSTAPAGRPAGTTPSLGGSSFTPAGASLFTGTTPGTTASTTFKGTPR